MNSVKTLHAVRSAITAIAELLVFNEIHTRRLYRAYRAYLGGNVTENEDQNDNDHDERHVLFTGLLLTSTTTSVHSQQCQGRLKVTAKHHHHREV